MYTNLVRNIDWALLFVRTVNFLHFYFQVFCTQSVKTTKYILSSFSENTYVFFEGSDIPVRLEDYKESAAGTPPVIAFYNRDTKSIYTNKSSTNGHTLLIGSAAIYHGDVCLYDLTNFFDTTLYYGNRHVAPLNVWIAVWCLENGIFLDRKKEFTIEFEFIEHGTKTFHLWSTTENNEWDECTCLPIPIHRQVEVPFVATSQSVEQKPESVEQQSESVEQKPELVQAQPESVEQQSESVEQKPEENEHHKVE